MNFKRIVSAVCAGAMALALCATSAFAATVDIDTENPGTWSSSGRGITKAELESVGGDVRIVLEIETQNKYGLADQLLLNPIDYDNGWKSQTDYCTSDTAVAKEDGWFCIPEGSTTCEFVLSQEAIADLGDSGLCFSNCNVLIKSATYELGTKQAEMVRLNDADGKAYCFGNYTIESTAVVEEEVVEEEVVVVEEVVEEVVVEEVVVETVEEEVAVVETVEVVETVTVTTTTAAQTGNTSVAVIASVMAIAAGAAFVSRKK